MPKWGYKKINNLTIKFYHENMVSIVAFFESSESDWRTIYKLKDEQIYDLQIAKSELGSNPFLAETLINKSFEIIPIISPE